MNRFVILDGRICPFRGVPYSMLIELGRQEVTIKSPFLYLAICDESPQKSGISVTYDGIDLGGIDSCSINRNIKRSYVLIAQETNLFLVLVSEFSRCSSVQTKC